MEYSVFTFLLCPTATSWRAASWSRPHCPDVLHHSSLHRARLAVILPLHCARARPLAFAALHRASAPSRPSRTQPPLLVGPLSPAHVELVVLAHRHLPPARTPRTQSTGSGPLSLCCKYMFSSVSDVSDVSEVRCKSFIWML